jgi:hypothetical protein
MCLAVDVLMDKRPPVSCLVDKDCPTAGLAVANSNKQSQKDFGILVPGEGQ